MTKPLTIEELRASAAGEITERQQLDAPAYPQPEPEPARPTLAERWAEFWRNRRIAQLRAKIQSEQHLIDGTPEAVLRARMEEFEAHEMRLKEIEMRLVNTHLVCCFR